MGLIEFIIILAVVGFALWVLLTYVPMPDVIKKVIIGIAALILVILLLQAVGVDTGFNVRV